MSRNFAPVCLLLSLAGAVGCGGDSNNPMMTGDNSDMSMPVKPPDMARPKADMARVKGSGTDSVGSTCTGDDTCSGYNPDCITDIPGFSIGMTPLPLPAPMGYCTNSPCKQDDDCGDNGWCFSELMPSMCFGTCQGKGECAKVNPNNICVNVMGKPKSCFPNPIRNSCDPTKAESTCKDGESCVGLNHLAETYRAAMLGVAYLPSLVGGASVDDVGACLPSCKIGDACEADGNVPRACYYLNQHLDSMDKPTAYKFAGLACLPNLASAQGGGPDAACTVFDACQGGYECNVNMAGGAGKVCKKLCHNGGPECIIGECKNAFKLDPWGMDDIGLCL